MSESTRSTKSPARDAQERAVNSVELSGRVSADPESRTLPSGDEVVSFRVVVPRDARARRRSRQTVDTIEVSAWSAKARRTALRLSAGDEVTVTGQLRRRFRRAGGAPQSFVSVELEACVRRPPVASST